VPLKESINQRQHFEGVFSMASSAASIPVPSLAQPTIDAIQQQITALLPSNLAAAITSQFAGAPVLPSTIGALPAIAFSFPGSGSDASASVGAFLAQPTINAIQQQIAAFLPSNLASAITSQFAGASPAMGQAVLPTPAVGASLATLFSDQASAFLSLLPTT